MSPVRSASRVPGDRLDALLHSLDAAPPASAAPRDDLARARADAALERLLAVGRPTGPRGRRDPLVLRARRAAPSLTALTAATAAAVVGVALFPGSGGAATAYASTWVPVPVAASPEDTATAQEACAEASAGTPGPDVARLRPAVAERRGALVLLAMDDGTAVPQTLTCLVAVPADGKAAWLASGGGGGFDPPADAITPPGLFEQTTPGDELSVVDGKVGERVTGVTVHTAQGFEVAATVQDGYYVAWWPGRATRWTREVPEGQGWGCAGVCDGLQPVDDVTFDVTLDDGTVLRDVTPRS